MEPTELGRRDGVHSPSPRSAIDEIVRVFEEGCQAAAALRGGAGDLTPSQLERELSAIERRMLNRISLICDDYMLGSVGCLVQN